MELYRDYGIASYNLSIAGERMAMTYWSLKDALQHTIPKLVIIDMHALEYGNQKNDPKVPARVHWSLDVLKSIPIKYNAVKDVVEGEQQRGFFSHCRYIIQDEWN